LLKDNYGNQLTEKNKADVLTCISSAVLTPPVSPALRLLAEREHQFTERSTSRCKILHPTCNSH